ncbi:NAD(P)H-binding protein [Rhodovulum kholense]|uniref:Nucleoside-diphosphate-sugar epimerase n=1 Tax=Rhodovulum kholense TaxID=453584 RepID=A0A8E3ASZ0_9RHOB|nr:NAD(P)H-binding protein [Rhodovulum kholense]PTW52235.1 nucleoside-diphosphate-sugar epimerase [Rhodovulum kholense]
MKVLVIGATGGIGRQLLPRLRADGHEVRGLHRKPAQPAGIAEAGAVPVSGDIVGMTVDDFTRAAEGCEVLVFSAGAAGSGSERTTATDGDAPAKVVAAAERLGIRRLCLVSACPEAGRQRARTPGFEHYMAEKKRADVAVAASGLDRVIPRPGTLVHEGGEGRGSPGLAVPCGWVARGTVARVLAGRVGLPGIRREILDLTHGVTPVAAALDAVARGEGRTPVAWGIHEPCSCRKQGPRAFQSYARALCHGRTVRGRAPGATNG